MTELLISLNQHDRIQKDLEFLLMEYINPTYFEVYLPRFLGLPGVDPDKLLDSAWCIMYNIVCDTMLRILFPGQAGINHWSATIQFIIENGVDIHQTITHTTHWTIPMASVLGIYPSSAYSNILQRAVDPLEADESVYNFLDILKRSGVSISSYIDRETREIMENWNRHTPILMGKQLHFIYYEGLPVLSWRWAICSTSPALEVLNEFQNFISDKIPFLGIVEGCSPPSHPDDFQVWMQPTEKTCSRSFPFHIRPLDCALDADIYFSQNPHIHQSHDLARYMRDKRFARQEARKWRKAHKGEKIPVETMQRKTMPGSWVD